MCNYKDLMIIQGNAINDIHKILKGIPESQFHSKGSNFVSKSIINDSETKLNLIEKRLSRLDNEIDFTKT